MKTRLRVLAALALLSFAFSASGQQALKTDTLGNPTTPLNLSGPQVTGLPSVAALVAFGDSMLSYDPSHYGAGGGIPEMLASVSAFWRSTTFANVAISGDSLQQMLGNGEYATFVHPHAPAAGHDGYFLFWAGVNDAASTDTPATIYAHLQTLWALARSDGFKVVAFCLTPTTNATYNPYKIAQINSFIRSDPTRYDYLVEADKVLTDPTNLTYFRSDNLHPTTAGHALIFAELFRVISSGGRGSYNLGNGQSYVDGNGNLFLANGQALYIAPGSFGGTNSNPVVDKFGSVNVLGFLSTGQASTAAGNDPSTVTSPMAGAFKWYFDLTGKLHVKSSDGTDKIIGPSS